jgi:molybdenum cofactor cytidylyltransferase
MKENPQPTHPRSKTTQTDGWSVGILLAAGVSRRMGKQDKLLRKIDGISLIRRSAQTMLQSNLEQVFVTIRAGSQAHKDELVDLPVTVIEVLDASCGMSASIRAGVAAIPVNSSVLMVGLADMPDLTPSHYNLILEAHNIELDRLIIRPITPMSRQGNPVLFDIRFAQALRSIDGDQGARDILKSAPEFVYEVEMLDEAVSCDLDTPEAWEQWVSSREMGC